jgi:putative nucleotidyltransferase with HDIG domain
MVDFGTLELKIARSENLPPLPHVVSAVLQHADSAHANNRDLARLIESDTAILAKLLRLANSAEVAPGEQVASAARAIALLGVNTVRSLVIGAAYQQVIGSGSPGTRFSKIDFWQHSLAVAISAKIIAKLCNEPCDEIYAAAMLHDVGMIILERFLPSEYERCLEAAIHEEISLFEAERRLLGFDHTQAGEQLANRWNLPDRIKAAIRFHHEPFADPDHRKSTCIVAVADAMAHRCGLRNHSGNDPGPINPLYLEFLAIPEAQCEAIRLVAVQEVVKLQEALRF